MWLTIKNIFERHTLLNKLAARRKFYTATKSEQESVLEFSNRIRHMAATLKSMDVIIEDSEMAMTLLCGLPDPYDPLISALDAIGTEESVLEFDHVKSRIMQEEQRIKMRTTAAVSKSEAGALISKCHGNCGQCNVANKERPKCAHCGKIGHTIDKCWKKYPHLNPHTKRNQGNNRPAFVATRSNDDPGVVCLIGETFVTKGSTKTNEWLIDSGCSNHMTYNKSLFTSLSHTPKSFVELGNGSKAAIVGSGTISLTIQVSGRDVQIKLENVLLVPELGFQLLSVPTLSKRGFSTIFQNGRCFVMKRDTTIASGTLHGTLYKLDVPYEAPQCALLSSTLDTWHQRLAHVDATTIRNMVDKNIVTGIKLTRDSSQDITCDGCILGKGHRSPIPKKSMTRSSNILQLVHSDVNGPLETASIGGSRYFITFIDDYSKWTVVYMMRTKSESFNCFQKYHKYAEVHTGRRVNKLNVIRRTNKTEEQIKSIRTDNGGEYISNKFKDYLLEHGISHQLTVAYTPQQNGVSERMNRTLIDLVRSMIHTAGLEKKFWAEALQTAVHIRNRVTSRSLPPGKTPYHLWMNKVPDLSYLRIFGSDCFYTISKQKVKKLDPRATKAIFMGYSSQSKGYKLWDPETQKMIVSRDVTFRETTETSQNSPIISTETDENINRGGERKVRFDVSSSEEYSTSENSYVESNDAIHNKQIETPSNSEQVESSSDSEYTNTNQDENPAQNTAQPRRSARKFTQTKPYWLSLSAHALSARVVPVSYKKATTEENIDFWKPGIDREHDCLLRNNTWTIVNRVPGMHVLPCKYVFRVKDGKPKARMVILGCQQIFGLDYYHTFAPVVKFTTIRTLLATVAVYDWECEQMDVVTAFLNGDLDEDIYMQIPEGLRTPDNEGKVCKLNKALYGLKQAPRQWYAKIHNYLTKDLKFTSSINDPCLYTRKSANEILIIALYVDDLLLIGNSKFKINKLKGEFKQRFEMKDLGAVAVMLGIEINRDRPNRKLYISQKEYTDHVLTRFGMKHSRPVTTPMEKPCDWQPARYCLCCQ